MTNTALEISKVLPIKSKLQIKRIKTKTEQHVQVKPKEAVCLFLF
jgi:hypothetical protein